MTLTWEEMDSIKALYTRLAPSMNPKTIPNEVMEAKTSGHNAGVQQILLKNVKNIIISNNSEIRKSNPTTECINIMLSMTTKEREACYRNKFFISKTGNFAYIPISKQIIHKGSMFEETYKEETICLQYLYDKK